MEKPEETRSQDARRPFCRPRFQPSENEAESQPSLSHRPAMDECRPDAANGAACDECTMYNGPTIGRRQPKDLDGSSDTVPHGLGPASHRAAPTADADEVRPRADGPPPPEELINAKSRPAIPQTTRLTRAKRSGRPSRKQKPRGGLCGETTDCRR